ncbi:MAG: ABC transporter permease, partial [Dehalococcoidia bacterium]
ASANFNPTAVDPGGLVLPLATLQQMSGNVNQINYLGITLQGGVRGAVAHASAVQHRVVDALTTDPAFSGYPFVQSYLRAQQGGLLGAVGQAAQGNGATLEGTARLVRADKASAVQTAKIAGNVVTTVFLILGLFSIAAGAMLLFLIFVMLATERKVEMGMLRAVGVRRSGLVQAFVSEGTAYVLLSGAIGAGLGILVAFSLVTLGARLIPGGSNLVQAHVTGRSFVVAYCLGVTLTFLTMLISSIRVSRLNISAAVRDLPDVPPAGRQRFHGRRPLWVVLGTVFSSLAALLFLYALLGRDQRSGTPFIYLGCLLGFGGLTWLARGLGGPWLLTQAIVAFVLGAVLFAVGRLSHDPFPFGLSISFLLLGAGQLARYLGAPPRRVYTTVGVALFVYWALPLGAVRLISGHLDGGGPEMFFLSGVMMVIGSTLLLVYNAELLTGIFALSRQGADRYLRAGAGLWIAIAGMAVTLALRSRIGDTVQLLYLLMLLFGVVGVVGLLGARFSRFAPALQMAIAYPLASRFRTGMTIAMFSLIIFSLTLISTLNANFASLFSSPDAQGGWDIHGTAIAQRPIEDLRAALKTSGVSIDLSKLQAVGRRESTTDRDRRRQVRNAGDGEQDWRRFSILAADTEYLQRNKLKLQAFANGYKDPQAVWDAVASTPGLAVVDAGAIRTSGFRDPESFALNGVTGSQSRFDPLPLDVRDTTTGHSGRVTVIGIVDRGVSEDAYRGMVVSQQTFTPIFGPASLSEYFIRVGGGANPSTFARQLRSALLTSGFQAESYSDIFSTQQQLQTGFSYLLQGFMSLGLFVGVAAVGVIAFRSVVERRQQIGMLRALGFQRSTIALSFLFEGTFIAILGILSGVVGATRLARNSFHGNVFGGGGSGFFIPWTQGLVCV